MSMLWIDNQYSRIRQARATFVSLTTDFKVYNKSCNFSMMLQHNASLG